MLNGNGSVFYDYYNRAEWFMAVSYTHLGDAVFFQRDGQPTLFDCDDMAQRCV